MTKLAFIGLGRMSSVMARRPIEAGHNVAVRNRTSERRTPCARAAVTPAEPVTNREPVITALFTPGAMATAISAIGRVTVCELRAQLSNEVTLLDMPVPGRTPQAAPEAPGPAVFALSQAEKDLSLAEKHLILALVEGA